MYRNEDDQETVRRWNLCFFSANQHHLVVRGGICLLYTSDAADDLLCVDLGGRRIIKKKKHIKFTK